MTTQAATRMRSDWPRRTDVAVAQAGRGAPFAARRGPGDGALGVTVATVTAWRDLFLAAGEAALATRPTDGETLESERLKRGSATCCSSRSCWSRRSPGWRRAPFGPRQWKR